MKRTETSPLRLVDPETSGDERSIIGPRPLSARGEGDGTEAGAIGPLALYVHIPFCETKCPYCDFNTYTGIETLIPSYVGALQREVAVWGQALGRPAVKTMFFGGGTPSYLPAERIASVVEAIRSSFELATDAEVTLEANPGDFNPSKLAAYLDLGVNRLSIGIQSLSERLLKVLGRRHSADEAVQAYRMAVEAGFGNVSIDLMYGLPHQSIEDWRQTLDGAAELSPPHVSMYCLTLEGGTPMEQWVGSGQMPEPDPDLAADMYLMAQEVMGRQGYRHYEISNWARPGFESRHNLSYWLNQPYLGVGPGAHSYLSDFRFFNLRSPREYVRRLQDFSPPHLRPVAIGCEAIKSIPVVEAAEAIDRRLEMAETLMMGLRLDTGIGVGDFERRFDVPPAQAYGETIDELTSLGLLEAVDGRLRLTPRGRMLGNEVFSRFFA